MNFGHLDLNTVWFIVVGVLFTGYVTSRLRINNSSRRRCAVDLG